ncbi:MAG: protein kinase domain-containing protein, partial [Gaiellaceae bacterium]
TYYIAMEHLPGRTLKEIVMTEAPLAQERVVDLGVQILQAAGFAHRHGVIHRDFKPHNVIVDEDGQAKVTDFGIARSLDVHGVTETGTVLGTSDYIAPEQARGEKVDQKTDVYSLGIVLFELLTGEVPYEGDNFVAVAMRHVHDPVPSVLERRPDVPVRLDRALQQAMAKDPEERLSTEELVDELEACSRELGTRDEEGATLIVPRARRPQARRPRPEVPVVPILLIALAMVALAGGSYLFLDGSPDVPIVAEEPASGPVRLAGVTAYDPEGDGTEHDEDAPNATDGDPETDWSTETYQDFTKPGVGLVLRAPTAAALSRLTLMSDTGGFQAKIQAGPSPEGPFVDVSGDEQEVREQTTFEIDTGGENYRYYVIWLRLPREGGQAEINEVTART